MWRIDRRIFLLDFLLFGERIFDERLEFCRAGERIGVARRALRRRIDERGFFRSFSRLNVSSVDQRWFRRSTGIDGEGDVRRRRRRIVKIEALLIRLVLRDDGPGRRRILSRFTVEEAFRGIRMSIASGSHFGHVEKLIFVSRPVFHRHVHRTSNQLLDELRRLASTRKTTESKVGEKNRRRYVFGLSGRTGGLISSFS